MPINVGFGATFTPSTVIDSRDFLGVPIVRLPRPKVPDERRFGQVEPIASTMVQGLLQNTTISQRYDEDNSFFRDPPKLTREDIPSKGHCVEDTTTVRQTDDKDNAEEADIISINTTQTLSKRSQGDTCTVNTETPLKDGRLACDLCSKSFISLVGLEKHIATHVSGTDITCGQCSKQFSTKREIERHIGSRHGNLKRKAALCSFCDETFPSENKLRQHMNIHNTCTIRHRCHLCSKDFSTKGSLKDHIRVHPPSDLEKLIKCEVCEKKFTSDQTMRLHMQIHLGTQEYQCDICQTFFSRKGDRDRHRLIHTGDRPYDCPHCDLAFIQKGELNRHLNTHLKESSSHYCSHCDKVIIRKCDFRRHMASHKLEQMSPSGGSLTCSVCRKNFDNADDHKQHMNIHDLACDDVCKVCGKICGSVGYLNIHMRSHSKDGDLEEVPAIETTLLPCDKCSMKFTSTSNLRRHQRRVHIVSEQLPCDVCAKEFVTKSNLSDHVRLMHATPPILPCAICNKSFKNKKDILRHEKKHVTQKIATKGQTL